MKTIRRLLPITTLLLYIPESYALICTTPSGRTQETTSLNTTIAISNSQPKGTILWRQATQTATIDCWVDFNGYPAESLYLYVNPKGLDIGPDVEVGVTYEGNDYLFSSLAGGKIKTNHKVSGCGPEPEQCGWKKERKSLTYSIFLSKKSPSGPPKEGDLTFTNNYMAFQIDGQYGMRPNKSYNVVTGGTTKLRYIPCESKISINPATIKFGKISSDNAAVGKLIQQVPFTIVEQRTCPNSSSVYGINGYLTPLQAITVDSYNTTLLPLNNMSVGISLLRQDDGTPLPFKREFTLVPPTSDLVSTHRFLATLKWRTARPTLGRFDAGAALNIYYK